jgi:hypothetical protein
MALEVEDVNDALPHYRATVPLSDGHRLRQRRFAGVHALDVALQFILIIPTHWAALSQ